MIGVHTVSVLLLGKGSRQQLLVLLLRRGLLIPSNMLLWVLQGPGLLLLLRRGLLIPSSMLLRVL
jgi:hypothetical protein